MPFSQFAPLLIVRKGSFVVAQGFLPPAAAPRSPKRALPNTSRQERGQRGISNVDVNVIENVDKTRVK
jgi:hypothetical protein